MRVVGVLVVGAWLGWSLRPTVAEACGAYVSRAREDVATFNDAIEFAVMREGTTTFVTVRNEYRGPSEEFAIVVPVPALLGPEDVATLDPSIFAELQHLTGPVLTYEMERDPCADDAPGGASGSGNHAGAGGGTDAFPPDGGVRVEARFAAGEYDVVVLSATQSAALGRWLGDHGYKMPTGLPPLLAPYVTAGWKFFVAKVDPARVHLVNGRAALSPLRFRYDSPDLAIPVRLATLNSAGQQDVRLYVFADKVTEVANRANVDIPRGATLSARGRDEFSRFYQALFERTLAVHPDAAITEFVGTTTERESTLTQSLGASAPRLFTLTRLHLRVTKGGNVDDLVLKGTTHAAFRANYVYRTPWRGTARCASPRPGVWETVQELGGAGAGTATGAPTIETLDMAASADPLPPLEELVTSPIDALGVKPTTPRPAPPPLMPSLPSGTSPDDPKGKGGGRGGCGCGTGPGAGGSGALALLVLALGNVRRRRDLSGHVEA